MLRAHESVTTDLRALEPACALVQDLLPLYLEGEVSPASRDQITDHLAACPRCAGFMAGAQSVRSQLRRDQLQRAASVGQDAPRRGAVLLWRELLAGAMAMLLCLPGGVAAAGISEGLRGSPGAMAAGLLIATMVVAGLLGLARIIGPLTSPRLSAIFGGVALGGAGVMVLFIFGSSGSNPLGMLAGFGVGLAGLVGVWSGVARDGRLPALPAA